MAIRRRALLASAMGGAAVLGVVAFEIPRIGNSSGAAASSERRGTANASTDSLSCPETITAGEDTSSRPTSAQRRAAADLVEQTRAFARPYRDFSLAVSQGFRQTDTLHWYSPAYYADGRTLDPQRPEFFLYDNDHRLLGVMYMTAGRPGPQIGGSLTVWHTHCSAQLPCVLQGGILEPSDSPKCANKRLTQVWMLHVWLVPNRLGPFAQKMAPVAPA